MNLRDEIVNPRKLWRLKGNARLRYFYLCYILHYVKCIRNAKRKGKSDKKIKHYKRMLQLYRKDYRSLTHGG